MHCSWNSYLYTHDVVLTPVVGGAVGPGGDVGAGGDGAEVLEVTKIWKKKHLLINISCTTYFS